MIKDFEQYHGVILSRLVHHLPGGCSIRTYPSPSNASYVVNDEIGLYVKHSTKRLSPWSFTFQVRHRNEIREMQKRFKHVFVVFVCHTDGIVCLRGAEFASLVSRGRKYAEWVRISRRPRGRYTVAGKQGLLKSKIGNSEFPAKLFGRKPGTAPA